MIKLVIFSDILPRPEYFLLKI